MTSVCIATELAFHALSAPTTDSLLSSTRCRRCGSVPVDQCTAGLPLLIRAGLVG
jgi:hypothetical protein